MSTTHQELAKAAVQKGTHTMTTETLKKAYDEAQVLSAAYYEAAAMANGDWTEAQVASQMATEAWRKIRIAERAS